MCRELLIGGDHPLPSLEAWRAGTVFSGGVVLPGSSENRVLVEACRFMRRERVVYVGAHEGCGCGFCYDTKDELAVDVRRIADAWRGNPSDLEGLISGLRLAREDSLKGRASVAALRRYLEDASRGGPVDLMCVWAGVWPPERGLVRERVSPSYFANDLKSFVVPLWTVFAIERL